MVWMFSRLGKRVFAIVLGGFLVYPPASALIRMDAEGINLALKYGMQNSGLGLFSLLGPNWIEGPEGSLLNIYTPFMMLATKAARGGYPTDPTDQDIKDARKRYYKTLRTIRSPREPLVVKFSVSLYGETPGFANALDARVQGIGRGKSFNIRPYRTLKQKKALEVPDMDYKPYEAMNAYYFEFSQLENMDEFSLILTNPRQPEQAPIVFRVKRDKIY